MLPSRTALGLSLALLALPATATARPADLTAGGQTGPSHTVPLPYREYYGAAGLPDTNPQSPDAADAARAGEIAKAMEHYQRSQPAASHDDSPAWPDIAVTGVILLATAGAVVRVRLRRSQRVAA